MTKRDLGEEPSNSHAYTEKMSLTEVRGGNKMFWWLYYDQEHLNRPLVIWLHGGAGGASSGHGNLGGIGPKDVKGNIRKDTWAKHVDLLFVDWNIGAGFSIAAKGKHTPHTASDVAEDLVILLKRIFDDHKELKSKPIHIFGESYGAKIAIEFAHRLQTAIETKNHQHHIECHLKSVTSISGWISPIHTIQSWPDVLDELALVDSDDLHVIKHLAEKTANELNAHNAHTNFQHLTTAIRKATHGVDWCHMLMKFSVHTNSQLGNEKFDNIYNEEIHVAMNAIGVGSTLSELPEHYRTIGTSSLDEKEDFLQPLTATGK